MVDESTPSSSASFVKSMAINGVSIIFKNPLQVDNTSCISFQESRLTENVTWDQNLFESAKSSLIFEIVHREKCIGDVVAQSLLSYFKGVGHNYNQ